MITSEVNTSEVNSLNTSSVNAMETSIERTKTNNCDKYDDDIKGKKRVFMDSTHKYIIYFAFDRSINGIILGVIVLLIQFILYGILTKAGIKQLKETGNPIVSDYCWYGEISSFAELKCSVDELPDGEEILGAFALSCILLVFYLEYDLLACIKVWLSVPSLWAKLTAIVIFSEACYAFYVGIIFAYSATIHGSTYDAIINVIGVLFVHDLDEKLYEAASIIDKEEMTRCRNCCCGKWCTKYLKCCCVLLCIIIAVCAGFVIAVYLVLQYFILDELDVSPAPTPIPTPIPTFL